jgi:hypothetical protein
MLPSRVNTRANLTRGNECAASAVAIDTNEESRHPNHRLALPLTQDLNRAGILH